MINDFESKLEKYAELAVHVGANVQSGQRLLLWRVSPESVLPW